MSLSSISTGKKYSARKNLLVVPAGDNSLHTHWIDPDRSYDIWTIYYGDNMGAAKRYEALSDRLFVRKGLKIELARLVFLPFYFRPEISILQAYDYIWFPDDDIDFPPDGGGIEELFATAHDLQADVFQPAIENAHTSHLWDSTKIIPGAYCHRTNVVEIMAHGFGREAFLSGYLPAIHTMSFMRAGWGIEQIAYRMGEANLRRPLRTFVIDSCPVIHTRPTGTGDGQVRKAGDIESIFVPQIRSEPMKTLAVFPSLEEALAEAA